MIIIGITGTIGAGKGTIVDYLIEHKSFSHYSVREYLISIIEDKNLPVNRDSMVIVANELRAMHSPSFIIEELYKQAVVKGNNCIIESIRTPGEIEALRKMESFYLFAVDAEPQLRYNRILQRASETDNISFQTFVENEKREMNSQDPNKQNLSKCIEQADFVFKNDSSKENLFFNIESVIRKLL
ncbi:MAG: AAA family ATPase [Bacteroidota bacterium]